ncbi:astacin-like metalloendopeptidase [Apostichopus japonicus]|uniref:astacin-like metalloendopeptidase n=1 Tax=Stichopus japonicus TaxID=307972 RepID=UPI003AB38FC7
MERNILRLTIIMTLWLYHKPVFGQSCQHHLTSGASQITSPGFPNEYANNLTCTWTIEVSAGMSVELKIEEFNLEVSTGCYKDFLSVYDGSQYDGTALLTPSCGSEIPWPFPSTVLVSTNNLMTVLFTTDGSNIASGFRATFEEG